MSDLDHDLQSHASQGQGRPSYQKSRSKVKQFKQRSAHRQTDGHTHTHAHTRTLPNVLSPLLRGRYISVEQEGSSEIVRGPLYGTRAVSQADGRLCIEHPIPPNAYCALLTQTDENSPPHRTRKRKKRAVLEKNFQREISLSLSSVWCFLIATQFTTQCAREKRDFYKKF